jgi:elongation factor Ts
MNIEQIKELRELTGAGLSEVKAALEEAKGDKDKAIKLLQKKGLAKAESKSGRSASQGVIFPFVHMDKVGVLVELNCETDFVARTDEFKDIAKNIAIHVGGMNPLYLDESSIDDKELQAETVQWQKEAKDKSSDVKIQEKIVAGMKENYLSQYCLYNQKLLVDESKTVAEYIEAAVLKLGENIKVSRFIRWELGL